MSKEGKKIFLSNITIVRVNNDIGGFMDMYWVNGNRNDNSRDEEYKQPKNSEYNLGQAIIESLPHFSYIIDSNGIITHMNHTAQKVLKEDNISENIKSAFDLAKAYKMSFENDESEARLFRQFAAVLRGDNPIQDMIIKCIRNNEERYLNVSAFPLKEGDKTKGGIVTCRDVTEEHQKNVKLREEREKFISISTELKTKCDIIEILRNREKEHLMHLKDVINNISEGLIVLDNKGNFNFCNKRVYSIIEINPSEIIHFPNIFKKYKISYLNGMEVELGGATEWGFKGSKSTKNLVVTIQDKHSGRIKYIEFNSSPIMNKKDELLYTIITIKDVTEIKMHELNAEEQTAFIRDVVDTVDIPIAVINYPEMNIRLANRNFEEFIQNVSGEFLKAGDIIGCSIEEIFNKTIGFELYKALLFSGDSGKEFLYSPLELEDIIGNKKFYKIKFKPCRDKRGQTSIILIHAIDITEEIKHSLELEKITRLKDEFFTVISHELRTPLTIIYSSLQLVYDIYNREITTNLHRALARISQNCSRLLKLINNILDISKAEAGFLTLNPVKFDVVSATELIVTSVNFYAKSKGIDLIFDTNEEEAEVAIDKDKYEKILLNLLSNAVKFTPSGRQILVDLTLGEDVVKLSVKDEGMGIPEDKVHSIFDRFAQVNSSLSRRAEGTGIGLSLVKKLVELMGGQISVESELDKGSEFIVKINRYCIENDEYDKYSIVDEHMNEKINIEFSDIN